MAVGGHDFGISVYIDTDGTLRLSSFKARFNVKQRLGTMCSIAYWDTHILTKVGGKDVQLLMFYDEEKLAKMDEKNELATLLWRQTEPAGDEVCGKVMIAGMNETGDAVQLKFDVYQILVNELHSLQDECLCL